MTLKQGRPLNGAGVEMKAGHRIELRLSGRGRADRQCDVLCMACDITRKSRVAFRT